MRAFHIGRASSYSLFDMVELLRFLLSALRRRWCWPALFGVLTSLLLFAACSDKSANYQVRFTLAQGAEVPTGRSIEVGVSLFYPPPGSVFLWESTAGVCEPRETQRPYTRFYSPSQPTNAAISVAVVAKRKTNFVGMLRLQVIGGSVGSAQPSPPPSAGPKHEIRVTTDSLPFNEFGGGDSKTEIAGTVAGPTPDRYRVVLYVRTDYWYVQPLIAAPYTDVDSEGKWSAWIHEGKEYAALLVERSDASFRPLSRIPETAFAAHCSLAVDSQLKPGRKKDQREGK